MNTTQLDSDLLQWKTTLLWLCSESNAHAMAEYSLTNYFADHKLPMAGRCWSRWWMTDECSSISGFWRRASCCKHTDEYWCAARDAKTVKQSPLNGEWGPILSMMTRQFQVVSWVVTLNICRCDNTSCGKQSCSNNWVLLNSTQKGKMNSGSWQAGKLLSKYIRTAIDAL